MIGIFDSGSGGLTVLRALTDALPERSLIYLGDHAAAPYGDRRPEEIYRLTVTAVQRLFDLGCRLVVLACNTAAASALRRLQQEWLARHYPDRRVLGVLVPMVEAITGVPWMEQPPTLRHDGPTRLVAVFATRRTVDSDAYPIEIGKRAPTVRVVQQACPLLVRLIESAAPRRDIRAAVGDYVGALLDRLEGRIPDVAMLGCTHYPLVADLFAETLPAGVDVLSQPDLVARSLVAYLARHPEFDHREAAPSTHFLTTGQPDPVSRLASAFFGRPVDFQGLAEDGIHPIADAGLINPG
jgi:glutamate racemase